MKLIPKNTLRKRNPFETKINDNTYILGRYCNTNSKGIDTHLAVLICLKDGNRYIEPIAVSEKKWEGMCLGNKKIIKATIQMIKDTAVRLKGGR